VVAEVTTHKFQARQAQVDQVVAVQVARQLQAQLEQLTPAAVVAAVDAAVAQQIAAGPADQES
jgi:hypothetical protein